MKPRLFSTEDGLLLPIYRIETVGAKAPESYDIIMLPYDRTPYSVKEEQMRNEEANVFFMLQRMSKSEKGSIRVSLLLQPSGAEPLVSYHTQLLRHLIPEQRMNMLRGAIRMNTEALFRSMEFKNTTKEIKNEQNNNTEQS